MNPCISSRVSETMNLDSIRTSPVPNASGSMIESRNFRISSVDIARVFRFRDITVAEVDIDNGIDFYIGLDILSRMNITLTYRRGATELLITRARGAFRNKPQIPLELIPLMVYIDGVFSMKPYIACRNMLQNDISA